MYAVVTTGGKQYRVEAGSELTIERLAAHAGSAITFDRVLMVGDGDTITVGTPTVAGASVSGTVLGESLGPKLVIFKFKQKVKYRRMAGHRQHFTRVRIDEISASGKSARADTAEAPAKQAKAEKSETAAPAKRAAAGRTTTTAKADASEGQKPEPTRKATGTTAKADDATADKPKPARRKPATPKAESEE